ncbi:MAG: hypothetical protein GF308_03435 [Candidatus Heimdallarchaeota archaeon]|nr:hypothetical protein [Candidatus Heimdallarchaeota archaeon]
MKEYLFLNEWCFWGITKGNFMRIKISRLLDSTQESEGNTSRLWLVRQ